MFHPSNTNKTEPLLQTNPESATPLRNCRTRGETLKDSEDITLGAWNSEQQVTKLHIKTVCLNFEVHPPLTLGWTEIRKEYDISPCQLFYTTHYHQDMKWKTNSTTIGPQVHQRKFFFYLTTTLIALHHAKTEPTFPLATDTRLSLWLECQGQTNLCTLFDCPGINLSWDGEERFGTPLMLDESTCPAIVIHTTLHCG